MGVVEREGMGTGVIEREGEAVRSLFSNENTVRAGRSGGYVMKYTHSLMHRVSRTCWPIMKSPGQGGQPSSSRERVSGSSSSRKDSQQIQQIIESNRLPSQRVNTELRISRSGGLYHFRTLSVPVLSLSGLTVHAMVGHLVQG